VESNGTFLEKSPVDDVKEVVKIVKKKQFKELFGATTVHFNPGRIFLWGASFGGYVGIAAMKQIPAINKGIFFAPAISMARLGQNPPEEEHAHHLKFMEEAWPNVYRGIKRGYKKLITDSLIEDGEENLQKLKGKQLLIYHSADDDTVSVKQSSSFSKKANAAGIKVEFHRLRTRGHNIKPTMKEFKECVTFLR
jgi:predicted peptidase